MHRAFANRSRHRSESYLDECFPLRLTTETGATARRGAAEGDFRLPCPECPPDRTALLLSPRLLSSILHEHAHRAKAG
jgi:hypothetical protein